MARKITTGEVGGALGGLNITNTSISAADNLDISMNPEGTGNFIVQSHQQISNGSALRFGDDDDSHYVALKSAAAVTANLTFSLPATDGTTGDFLQTDGSGNLQFAAATFSNFTQSSSFSAVANGQYFIDTNGGVVTATLPASPSTGDEIRFFDLRKTFDTFALTIGRNGRLIMGDSADLTVNTEGAGFSLVYSGNTYGWRILTV